MSPTKVVSVPCPRCGVRAGSKCRSVTNSAHLIDRPHYERNREYLKVEYNTSFKSKWSTGKKLRQRIDLAMTFHHIAPKDQKDVWKMLGPLDAKGEPGEFHAEHSMRVALLASHIAWAFGMATRPAFFAGLLHDVGKALVPACTLAATKTWTDLDKHHMERHVHDGFRLLRDRFDFTAEIIIWHHRFQPNGYPDGYPHPVPATVPPFSEVTRRLAEDYGEILMIADVFDAMHRVNSGSGGRALTSEEIKERMLKLTARGVPLEAKIKRLYDEGVLS